MAIGPSLYRHGKTVFVCLGFAAYGVAISIIGPSIPDLCDRMNITPAEIAIVFSLSTLGWVIGGILFGPLIDRLQKYNDLLVAAALITIALSNLAAPYCNYLWMYFIARIISELGYSILDLGGNTMIFNVWGEKSSSPLIFSHGAWAFGFAVGPLIIRPYLGPDRINHFAASNLTTVPYLQYNTTEIEESRIEVAYIISSIVTLTVAIGFVVFQFIGLPSGVTLHIKKRENIKQVFSLKAVADGKRSYVILMLTLFTFTYFTNAGREATFSTWLFSYAVEGALKLPKKEAALLDAAAKFCFLCSRLLTSLLALKVPVQALIFIEYGGVLTFVTCLSILGTKSKVYLWTFSCLFNFFSSPIWPTGLAWTNRYIALSGIIFSLMSIGSGSAQFFFAWLTGWLFTYRSPDYVMYIVSFNCVFGFVLFVIMQILGSKHGSRFNKTGELKVQAGTVVEEEAQMPLRQTAQSDIVSL